MSEELTAVETANETALAESVTEEERPSLDGAEADAILEAVLFAAGHPLSYATLAKLFAATPTETKKKLTAMVDDFDRAHPALLLLAMDDCAQICTREEYAPYIREALGIRRGGNLSNSSIEALAIIAYHQPVTRVYIDSVRGVDSSYAVSSLLERGLIECVGRLDQPGRPMLLGTTPDFLRCFGLSSLDELPEPEGFEKLSAALPNMTIEEILEGDAEAQSENGTAEIPGESGTAETDR